ncbi:hypothetical protein TcasGA2_TC031401 [Tribolium castaneum]|uniref:Uncharacterized protein n=1 Tax=Tribolium castaneum TaxID=7070 RepID=A0A139WAT5_TRICA|nr:hypothetical protein TcasGA2_TC031401 [Tribolium castaneum]
MELRLIIPELLPDKCSGYLPEKIKQNFQNSSDRVCSTKRSLVKF